MISIKSIDRHIGHERSEGVCFATDYISHRIGNTRHVRPVNGRWRAGRFSSGLCRYA